MKEFASRTINDFVSISQRVFFFFFCVLIHPVRVVCKQNVSRPEFWSVARFPRSRFQAGKQNWNVSTHVVVFDSVIYISATAELNKGVTDEFILDI